MNQPMCDPKVIIEIYELLELLSDMAGMGMLPEVEVKKLERLADELAGVRS
jgi:hypothetical protein